METKDNVEMAQGTTNETAPEAQAKVENAAVAATAGAVVAEGAANDKAESAKADAAKGEDAKDVGTHQEHIKEALALLCEHFPKAFIKEGDCKPLKIGILEDLKAKIGEIEGLSISKVRAAVRVYTTRLRYFYAVREGAKRVDLDGNEVDTVTTEHAEYARNRFVEINSKRQGSKPQQSMHRASGDKAAGNQRRGNGGNGGNRGGRGDWRGNNQHRSRQGGGFNNRPRRDPKSFEPAKESDLKVGRVVFVSLERNNYTMGTISEVMRDQAKVTMYNGVSLTIPSASLYVSRANPNDNRNESRYDKRNDNRGGFKGNNRPRGGHGGFHNNGNRQDRSHQRHDSNKSRNA